MSTPTIAVMDVQSVAGELRKEGIAVQPIRPGDKRPKSAGWTERSAEPDDFQAGDSLCILTGWISNCGLPNHSLLCVDLDSTESVERADSYLYPTGMIEGRIGKPRSHRYYRVDNSKLAACGWPEPNPKSASAQAAFRNGLTRVPGKLQFRGADGKPIVEVLASGQQSNCPPSVHTFGEVREWQNRVRGEPAVVDPADLLRAVESLAQACGWTPAITIGGEGYHVLPEPGRPANERKRLKKASGQVRTGGPSLDTTAPWETPGELVALLAGLPELPAGKGTVVDLASISSIPDDGRERRAGLWLNAVPDEDLSRSGSGGSDRFFNHLRVCYHDFGCSPEAVRRLVEEHYNPRLERLGREYTNKGYEVWSGGELDHKLNDTCRELDNETVPRGWKLLERAGGGNDLPRSWNDPERLATGFLKTRVVRFVKDTAFVWQNGRYSILHEQELRGVVRRFIQSQADEQFDRSLREWEKTESELKARENADRNSTDEHGEARRATTLKQLKANDKKKPKAAASVFPTLVNGVVEAVKSLAQLSGSTEFNSWLSRPALPQVLSVGNGLLNVRSAELIPHSPEWFSLTGLEVPFVPGAECPIWLQFIQEVTEGDDSKAAVLQEVAGATLDPALRVKFFAVLSGGGENGKSVFLSVLRCVLGNRNCAAVGLEKFSERFGTFSLLGKLANLVGDQGYLDSNDEGQLKAATGGDAIAFEQKGKDVLFGTLSAKLIFATNSPPTFSDPTSAVWRRLVAVPFSWTCPAEKRNPAMLTSGFWEGELSGILNWMLEGLNRLHASGKFTHSETCESLAGRMRDDSNPVDEFLKEKYVADPDGKVPVADVNREYDDWRAANGETKQPGRLTVRDGLQRVFPTAESRVTKVPDGVRGSKPARCYVGVRRSDPAG